MKPLSPLNLSEDKWVRVLLYFAATLVVVLTIGVMVATMTGRLLSFLLAASGALILMAGAFTNDAVRIIVQRDRLWRYDLAMLSVFVLIFATAIATAGVLAIHFLGGSSPYVSMARDWLQKQAEGKTLLIAAAAAATALLGGGFFYFRLRQRFLYGVTEALAGMAVAGHRISIEPGAGLPSETGFYFAVLTAGVYLVVRGLDNMHQGRKDRDPLSKWTVDRFTISGGLPARANSGANHVRNERQ